MAQLTGTFQGTSQTDSYLGEILNGDAVIINNVLTGVAATALTIDSLGGDDAVDAIVDISTAQASLVEGSGIGMETAAITMGRGSDTFTASSNVLTGTISTSLGLTDSTVAMGNGIDVVTIRGIARASSPNDAREATGTGVKSSTVDAGRGSDTIVIEAEGIAGSIGLGDGLASAVTDSTILGAQGTDVITITANGRGSGQGATSGISNGATGNSTIDGGNGSDVITISAESSASGRFNPISRAVGVSLSTEVNGGNGNDAITISANAIGNAIAGLNLTSYGLFIGTVDGGNGADTIEINATGQGGGQGLDVTVIGIEKSGVDGGNGSDTIDINVAGSSGPGATYIGVFQSTVDGGRGNDSITINVTGTTPAGGGSVGVRQGTLAGDRGRDNFFVRGVNLDLDDAVINGGSQNDVFDTGVGSAQISGDGGNDLIKLDFFDDTTMTIALLGSESIEIIGTEDKLGIGSSWTQTISDVEQYEVAGTIYNATDVVALLS